MRQIGRNALALAAALCVIAGGARAATPLPGDVDNDNKVTIKDALIALRVSVGHPDNIINRASADLTPLNRGGNRGDDKITLGDVIAILRLVVGLDRVMDYDTSKAEDAPDILPDIQFSLTTPRGTYDPAETIPFAVRVANYTDKVANWTFRTGCQVDLQVLNSAGEVVWRPTEICTDALTQLTLSPGESKEWDFKWVFGPTKNLRPTGTYTARAMLVDTDFGASLAFQVGENGTPVPLPNDTEPTFNLTPGRGFQYVNTNRGYPDETIRFLNYATVDGKTYTRVSLVPDGMRDVLLRLDENGDLIQRTNDVEGTRLKLNAKEGEEWVFEYGLDMRAQAKLVSRSAELKTPGGIYTDLLEFDFFVGPDAGWTEWVHPTGFWVGMTRNTIAGPVEFRLANRDAVGLAVSGDMKYGAILYPDWGRVNPGESFRFGLLIYDATGAFLKEEPARVTWVVDENVGTIDSTGLFTARSDITDAKGAIKVEAMVDGAIVVAYGTAIVGNPALPPIDPSTGGGETPRRGFVIDPAYAYVMPGAQHQFRWIMNDDNGQPIPVTNIQWTAESEIGTIDANGLFTAANVATGVWGAVSARGIVEGDMAVEAWTKVYVGPDADKVGLPDPATRRQLVIDPVYAAPEPGQQVQFTAKLLDANGQTAAATYEFRVDDGAPYGTIDANGLFTASQQKGTGGPVYVTARVDGAVVMESAAKVVVGGDPPVIDPDPPAPAYVIEFAQPYYYPKPGEQIQMTAKLLSPERLPVDATFKWRVEPDANHGTITESGLFTAGSVLDASGPVWADAYVDGKLIVDGYTKVWVGGRPDPVPMPEPLPVEPSLPPADSTEPPVDATKPLPGERLAYLEMGKLALSLVRQGSPGVTVQADLSGHFPDPSYALKETTVEVVGDQVILRPVIYRAHDGIVPMVLVPFQTTVLIPNLPANRTITVIAAGNDTKLVEQVKT